MPGTPIQMDILSAIQTENRYILKKFTDIFKSLLEIIKSTLVSGEDALISGFGEFLIRDKRKCRGRNPATDGDMILTPRQVLV